jgi:hypothetical protein
MFLPVFTLAIVSNLFLVLVYSVVPLATFMTICRQKATFLQESSIFDLLQGRQQVVLIRQAIIRNDCSKLNVDMTIAKGNNRCDK